MNLPNDAYMLREGDVVLVRIVVPDPVVSDIFKRGQCHKATVTTTTTPSGFHVHYPKSSELHGTEFDGKPANFYHTREEVVPLRLLKRARG